MPRIRLQQENAGISGVLQTQPLVEKMYYPALENHVGHQIAKNSNKVSVMLSFELKEDWM